MNIETFNKTLSWLGTVVVNKLDDSDFDMTLELNSSAGGPGENVTAYITAKSVCFISIPMVMDFSNCPQLRVCNVDQAISILSIYDLEKEYYDEVKDGLIKVLQFLDGEKELKFCIACYGYELYQDPIDWNYGN